MRFLLSLFLVSILLSCSSSSKEEKQPTGVNPDSLSKIEYLNLVLENDTLTPTHRNYFEALLEAEMNRIEMKELSEQATIERDKADSLMKEAIKAKQGAEQARNEAIEARKDQ